MVSSNRNPKPKQQEQQRQSRGKRRQQNRGERRYDDEDEGGETMTSSFLSNNDSTKLLLGAEYHQPLGFSSLPVLAFAMCSILFGYIHIILTHSSSSSNSSGGTTATPTTGAAAVNIDNEHGATLVRVRAQFSNVFPFTALALSLGVVYFMTGTFMSLLATPLVGHLYGMPETYAKAFRPYGGFTVQYMMIHPLLLGFAMATAFSLLKIDSSCCASYSIPAGSSSDDGGGGGPSGLGASAAIVIAGAVPVYTLGYASHRTPSSVVFSWQIHTATQLFIGALFFDYIWSSSYVRHNLLLL